MKSYPVHVPRDHYRGKDQRRLQKTMEYNRVADRIEKFINADMASQPEDTAIQYVSYSVAAELNEDPDVVRKIIAGIDCGHNGATIFRGDFRRTLNKLNNSA